jgi:ABC-type branched-subunit amino acid transport system ATPase component
MEMLEINNLKKNFNGLKVVDGLSFTLKKDKVTSLIGPNGAGKTTVFNVISGLCKADSGEIFLKNKSILNKSPYQIARFGIEVLNE